MKNYYRDFLASNECSISLALNSLYKRIVVSDFIQKGASTFANRILLLGMGLITSVIVARILKPEGRGLYAVTIAITAAGVQFGNFGLHASNTYHAAKAWSL